MSFEARVRNLSSLQAKIKRYNWGIRMSANIELFKLAKQIKQDVLTRLAAPKSGALVRRSSPSRLVRVSSPGEEPAHDLGELARSVEVTVDNAQTNLIISASARHAKWLELGTRRMLPRPFLMPALARWRSPIIDAIHRGIQRFDR